MTVPNTDVVVGDVLFLDTGDKVVADGVAIDSQVKMPVTRMRIWTQVICAPLPLRCAMGGGPHLDA